MKKGGSEGAGRKGKFTRPSKSDHAGLAKSRGFRGDQKEERDVIWDALASQAGKDHGESCATSAVPRRRRRNLRGVIRMGVERKGFF